MRAISREERPVPAGARPATSRRLLQILALMALLAAGVAAAAQPLRIGLTPVFLDDQVSLLRDWQQDLEQVLGRPVQFVQRTRYREISELLDRGRLDAAWICGAPYVRHRDTVDLLAVPVFNGAPRYRSYLIVHSDDTGTEGWDDLRGRVFAYSDPDSNSGALYPRTAMRTRGLDPEQLFRESFSAWGHRNVVEAVATGLADAGAVDGYVWETLQRFQPELTARTRVVSRSPEFGFPPVVVREDLDPELRRALRSALLGMQTRATGRALLDRLNLDRFMAGDPALYRGIAAMADVAVTR